MPKSRVTLFIDDARFGSQVAGPDHRFVFRSVRVWPGTREIAIVARLPTEPASTARSLTVHTFEPAQPNTPRFSGFPKVTGISLLTLRGTADPGVHVLLAGIGNVLHRARADSEGKFTLEVLLPEPGKHSLTLRARNRNKVLSFPSAPEVVEYDPRLAAGEGSVKATLELRISHKELYPRAVIELPKEDQRAVDLIAGQSTSEDFLTEIFGDYTLDGLSLFPSYFRDSSPAIEISGGTATFVIQGQRRSNERLPTTSGEIEIERAKWRTGERHALLLEFQDYTVQTMQPAPQTWGKGTAEWEIDGRGNQKMRIGVDYNPFRSTRSFLRLLRLSPSSFLVYPASAFVGAFQALLLALPILWLLTLAQRWSRSTGASLVSYVASLSRRLLAFSLIALAVNGAYALGYFLFKCCGKEWRHWDSAQRNSYDPLYLLSGGLILGVACAVLVLFLSWRQVLGNRAHKPLDDLARSLRAAALLGIAVLASAAALTALPSQVVGPRLLSLILVAPFSILLLLWLTTLGRLLLGKRPGLSARGRLLLVLCGGAIAFPLVPAARPAGVWAEVLSNSRFFFDTLKDWLPYAALLGILVLLKRASRAGQDAKAREVKLAALLFAGFLVGTQASVFLIPVPFLIALVVFPHFVLAPEPLRRALDQSRPYVLAERVGLLRAVLESAEARRFKGALSKLRKKVISGEMTPHDFEQQRAQVEAFVGEPRFGVRPQALDASEAVLSVGPCATDWENGIWALRRGALLALPLVILYVLVFLIKALWLQNPYRGLAIGLQLVGAFADWLLGAFFLGYFFSAIRGTSGLRKGLRVSFAIVACFLPMWLVATATADDLRALVLRVTQIILFYTVLGAWAFDYQIFRQLPRKDFTWRELVVLEELPSLTALASVALATIGVAINSILSQSATTLVKWLFTGAGALGPPPLP